jgi:uncharacterized protein YgbK (DUF1537 family)
MLVGIQADDLTGACDTGAPFAARGLETLVVIHDGEGPPPVPSPTPAVLAIDTESRQASIQDARARAERVGRTLRAQAPGVIYKKLDSTLRGRVAAEIDGMLDGAGLEVALMSPAFPAQHRVVVDGRLVVEGRPADETPFALDPAFPRTGASVLGLLAAGGMRPTASLPLVTVRRGRQVVAACLDRFVSMGGRVLAADAETAADLAVLAEAGRERAVLVAGSAGLATALARRETCAMTGRPTRPSRPLLVVAGSAHPATRAQLGCLGGRDGLDVVAPSDDEGADDRGRQREMVQRLAEAARDRIDRRQPGALLLTGGETAIAVLRALGAVGIRLAGQLEPGLALGTLAGGPFDGLAVMTKAGGFGDPDTLVRAWQACA